MAYDAKLFLDDWVRQNVKPVPFASRLQEAERLAELCRAGVGLVQVSVRALEDAVGMDLTSFMDDQIEMATFHAWEVSTHDRL